MHYNVYWYVASICLGILVMQSTQCMPSTTFVDVYSVIMHSKRGTYFSNVPVDVRNAIVSYCRGDTIIEQWFNLMRTNPTDIRVRADYLLLEDTGLINMRDKQRNHALLYMVQHSNVRMIKDLLAQGADIDMPNNQGITPLMQAVLDNNYDMTALLIAHGAALDACNRKGKVAYDIARDRKHEDIALILKDAMKNTLGIDVE